MQVQNKRGSEIEIRKVYRVRTSINLILTFLQIIFQNGKGTIFFFIQRIHVNHTSIIEYSTHTRHIHERMHTKEKRFKNEDEKRRKMY